MLIKIYRHIGIYVDLLSVIKKNLLLWIVDVELGRICDENAFLVRVVVFGSSGNNL